MRVLLVALSLALAPLPALARGAYGESSHRYYRSTDGSTVHGPTRGTNPAYGKVTATCRDGTSSYSHHARGTCSGHGGVEGWR